MYRRDRVFLLLILALGLIVRLCRLVSSGDRYYYSGFTATHGEMARQLLVGRLAT